MRTLLLTDAFLPHAGGSRIYYFNLYSGLAQQHGEQVTVVTRKSPGWQEFDGHVPGGLKIRRYGDRADHVKLREWPKFLGYCRYTSQTWMEERSDVIHTGDLFPPGVCGSLLSRLARVPYVTYCHGEEIPNTEGYRFQPHLRNWIYRNATALVANSAFTRQKLIDLGLDTEKIHVITPGVDCEHFKPQSKDTDLVSRHKLNGKLVFLTVGRLVARKGHEAVLTALARIPNRETIRYIIVGTGPEEERLKNLATDLNLGETVIFLGYVAEAELPKLFQTCDIFIMPNCQLGGDLEGFGMVFLEANAAGKPVIAGESGGTADAVQDGVTGFRVDPMQPDELLQRMDQLVSDEELRQRMGSAGRKRVCTQFDWRSRAAALHEINLSIVSNRGGRPSPGTNREPERKAMVSESASVQRSHNG